jgi:hypothetical protein
MPNKGRLTEELHIESDLATQLQESGFDPNVYIPRMKALPSELVQAYFSTNY